MNIALFSPNIKYVCGRSNIVLELANGLRKKGNVVFIITNHESDKSLLTTQKFLVHYVQSNPDNKSFYKFIRAIFGINKIVREHNIDIIHSHHRYCELISIWAKLLFRNKYKTIMSVHSLTFDKKLISYKSDFVVAVSRFIQNHLFYNYSVNKIQVIYNGVDTEQEIRRVKKKDKITILGFGRFEYEKGFDIFICAVNNLEKYSNKVELILSGEGSKYDELKKTSMNSKVPINFTKVDGTPWDLIAASDIVVIPSRTEPFGLTVLEAGLYEKCVIVSSAGGLTEVIDDDSNGLVFLNESADELTDKLTLAIESEDLRKRCGINLRERIIKEFSLKLMTDNYLKVYQN